MTPEERIKLLEDRVDALSRENFRLRQAQKDQHQLKKILPGDKWYVVYLQKSVADLERMVDERQAVIEQYQKHYEKWGSFYSDYERNR